MKQLDRNWEAQFDGVILSRGRDYFRQKMVSRLTSVPGGWKATVSGGDNYRVFLPDAKHDKGFEYEWTCTCPYFRDGGRCKHLAATAYTIEAHGPWDDDDDDDKEGDELGDEDDDELDDDELDDELDGDEELDDEGAELGDDDDDELDDEDELADDDAGRHSRRRADREGANQSERGAYERETTVHEGGSDLAATVDALPEKDVRKFLLQALKDDDKLYRSFMAQYGKIDASEAISEISNAVETCIDDNSNYGFIDWRGSSAFESDYLDAVSTVIDPLLERGQFGVAFEASKQVACGLMRIQIDDSNGFFTDALGQLEGFWKSCILGADDALRRDICEWLQDFCEKNPWEGDRDIYEFIVESAYRTLLAELGRYEEFAADIAELADGMIESDDLFCFGVGRPLAISARLRCMRLQGSTDEDMEEFARPYMDQDTICQIFIDRALERRDYQKAIALLKDGKEQAIRSDENMGGAISYRTYQVIYREQLLAAYRKIGDEKSAEQELMDLVVNGCSHVPVNENRASHGREVLSFEEVFGCEGDAGDAGDGGDGESEGYGDYGSAFVSRIVSGVETWHDEAAISWLTDCKASYRADEWPTVFEGILAKMKNDSAKRLYLAMEGRVEELMASIEGMSDSGWATREMRRFEDVLADGYSGKVLLSYRTEVEELLVDSGPRSRYGKAADLLRHMSTLPGGKKAAAELAISLRTRYSRRPALMDELRGI